LKINSNGKNEYTSLNNWKNILEQTGGIVFQFSGIATNEIRGYSINKKTFIGYRFKYWR
jgi:hypothetical protein